MLKVMVKNNERTPRFRTLRTFAECDIEDAIEFANQQEAVYWAVQVKSNAGPTGTWYELRTTFNAHAQSL